MSRIDPNEDATELLRSFLEQGPHPVAFLNPQLRYVAHSTRWVEAFGLQDASLLGRHHLDVLGDREPIGAELLAQCLAGRDITRPRVPLKNPDGSRDWMNWTITPRRAGSRQIVGLMIQVEVVTTRVELEQRLEAAREFQTRLFDKSPIGFNLSRPNGRWIAANPALLSMLGYTAEEAEDKLTCWDVTPQAYAEAERAQHERLRATGRYGPYEKEMVRKDGTLLPARLNGFMVQRGEEELIWSFVEDISRERALERARQVERIKAIQQSKLALLGEMAAGIAHEVNNPLQVIDACAYLLTELWSCAANDPEVTQQAIELLGDVRTATMRAGRIVDGLRRFARESDGQRDETISIPRLVEETLDLCRSRLQNHGVDLRVRVETDAVVRGNALELSQALLNLLINAFDAVKRSEQPWIALVARQVHDHVELSVEDAGPGIDPEHAARIFEPFFTTKAVGEGTGLGLSISRGLVETMGGSLVMDEACGHTRFVIRLPAEGAA